MRARPAAPAVAPAPSAPTVPGYRLLERMAHGKRLDTWDAWDDLRGTRCVIKLVRPDRRAQDRVVEALRREGEIATTLAHPHLVRGYEVLDDPVAVVLETLRGQTLGRVVEDGALGVPDVAELGLQLTSVLGFLHHHDWLHLDVKPGNVVVDHGRAVLIDLNLAGRPGEGRPGAGTPGYLAPEQAHGGTLTSATDVWALGVVLLECLTGEQPFGQEATWDTRRRWPLLHRRPPGPPTPPAHLPPPLTALLLSCVDHDPAARPRLADVRAVLEPLTGRPSGPQVGPRTGAQPGSHAPPSLPS